MPPQPTDSFKPVTTEDTCPWYQPLCKVTPVSKYLAMIIFILMPFVGGYIGYRLAPEKVVMVPVIQTIESVPTQTELVSDVPEPQIANIQVPSLETAEVEKPVTDGMAPTSGKSEIFITAGTSSRESLGIFEGVCSLRDIDENFLVYRSVLKTYLTDTKNISSHVYCGWSDDGSETILYKKSEAPLTYEVLHIELASCEGTPCTATDTVSVLKTVSQ
jgi:hypothetical protein